MKLGNFYGLTAPNIIILREQFDEDDFIKAVALLNNPVDKNFIARAKEELGFFRKALDNIPVKYTNDLSLNVLSENSDVIIEHGTLKGVSNAQLVLEQIKRYLAVKVACYVSQPNVKNTLDVNIFKGKASVSDVRKIFNSVITDYLNENDIRLGDLIVYQEESNVFINKLSRKFLDRRGDKILTNEKEKLHQVIVKAFQLEEEILPKIQIDNKEILLNDNEVKIIKWFKNHRDTLNSCLPIMMEKIITSNQKVFSMPFRDLVFRRPERLISEVVHFYKSANVSTGREKMIKNIRANIIEQLDIFKNLFEENVIQQGTLEEKKFFVVTLNSEVDGESLTILKRALKNYDLEIENCDEDKLITISKLFDFSRKLTKEFYDEIFNVKMSVSEWDFTIKKLNSLGIAGLNFYSTHLFIRSLKAYSFDDKIKIKKSPKEIENYESVLQEINAFLDSQLPLGTEIGGTK